MNPRLPPHHRWFAFGIVLEISLLGAAAMFNGLFNRPTWADFQWDWSAAAAGLAAVVPLLLGFFWLIHSPAKPFVRIKNFFDSAIRPVFERWSLLQIAVVSLLAGVCEEAFFRGAIQGGLGQAIGTPAALVAASVLFGICHWVTPAYAAIAGVMGLCLGGLWIVTGNLLAPIVTHAVYDFFGLVYLFRMRTLSGFSSRG